MSVVILGAGLVGTEAARLLDSQNRSVTVISRTSREIIPGIISKSANAANVQELLEVEPKPTAIINALNAPNYDKWSIEFPPLNHGALEYALKSGAPIVSVSNLYMYESSEPMVPTSRLRAGNKKGQLRQEMWEETKKYIDKGVLAAEVRASDYVSQGEQSPLGDRFVPVILKGKTPSVIGSTNTKHSWTAPIDVARIAIELIDKKMFGDVWHVPTNTAKTFQEVADEICNYVGLKRVKVRLIPKPIFHAIGVVSPIVKELRETYYQFENEFIINDQKTREHLKLNPTDWDILIRDLVNKYRN